MSKEELIQRHQILEMELSLALKEIRELKGVTTGSEQLSLMMSEQLESLRKKIFGQSSERYKKPAEPSGGDSPPPKPRVKKPSERYPNLPVREELIKMNPQPCCQGCGCQMKESGLYEESEQLTVIPKKFEIIKQKRVIYRCKCQGALQTTPSPPRMVLGSSYSDEMAMDVTLAKYCDLMPIERYVSMAARAGLEDLPAQSLIELTHQFADFVSPVYTLIKKAILESRILHADETPHKMLEGSGTKQWYLWGFSNSKFSYLECRDTRSGDVASDLLVKSQCQYLVSDVFSGYGKAIKVANGKRDTDKPIKNANCNAHARRYFFQCYPQYPDSQFYLDYYHEIYQLDKKARGSPPSPDSPEVRDKIKAMFEAMRAKALGELPCYPTKNNYSKALRYFLNNYQGLTLFLEDREIPLDNNSQERLLRSHVVGRKTWYGTHSPRGALTAAILFSIVESCKLNGVNPRLYFPSLVKGMLNGDKPFTPDQLPQHLSNLQ